MKKDPKERPNPIALRDSAKRIEYLKRCRSVIPTSVSASDRDWFENIREDLATIDAPAVREEAQTRFQRVVGCNYVFERNPKEYPKAVRRALDNLITYLEENDR